MPGKSGLFVTESFKITDVDRSVEAAVLRDVVIGSGRTVYVDIVEVYDAVEHSVHFLSFANVDVVGPVGCESGFMHIVQDLTAK